MVHPSPSSPSSRLPLGGSGDGVMVATIMTRGTGSARSSFLYPDILIYLLDACEDPLHPYSTRAKY